jgi:hypothetical protein
VRLVAVGFVCGDADANNADQGAFIVNVDTLQLPGSESPIETQPPTEAASCCGTDKQATCCDSGEKATCCGSEATAGGGCGCQ